MKTIALFLIACAVFETTTIAAATIAHGATASSPSVRWPAQLVAGNNQFALDLYRQLSEKEGPLFFSPYSVSTALAMTYAGARGDTAVEMAKTLHFTLPADQLHTDFASVQKQLQKQFTAVNPQNNYQFRIANRLWGATGYKFLDSFLKITRDDYGSELEQLDFEHQTEQARQTINGWVARQTADKIQDLLPAGVLQPDTRLVLTNAIYFKGDWQSPFKKQVTEKQTFHITAAKSADVDTMYQQKHFYLAPFDDVAILELPYKGYELGMVVILPVKVDGLAALEKSFTLENYTKWTANLRSQNTRVWLPRFQATEEMQLADTLSAMGMQAAFSPSAADFSGMDGQRDLFIAKVIHKAYVDVNEQGTEAAAATGISMAPTAIFRPQQPSEFRADHPFIFLIRDRRSGAILFMGRYVGPN